MQLTWQASMAYHRKIDLSLCAIHHIPAATVENFFNITKTKSLTQRDAKRRNPLLGQSPGSEFYEGQRLRNVLKEGFDLL